MTTDAVAIVGMACLFPGAPDLSTYWRNIVDAVDSIGEPPTAYAADRYLDPGSTANDRVYTTRGGWLDDLATFDPVRFGVMPSSVDGGEPDQFLALGVADRALADAAPGEHLDRSRAGVVIGHGTYVNRGFGTVLQHGVVIDQTLRILAKLVPGLSGEELGAIKADLKGSLPPFNAEMAPGLVPNMMSGRIANRLDLMGPNYTVDAACASSLVAVDLAMRDLREGRTDLMLAGGVHTSTTLPILQIFCQLEAVSRSGRIRPFDASADGTLLGEGAGFVVLKRLDDALDDADRIYAVVRSVGVSSDGKASGLLAPSVDGEELALRRAYDAAGVDPRTVGLIEAHGTGTPVGDEAELAALDRVFGAADGAGPDVALGAVKSMIAHLLPASGMAGLIKAALALHHRVLPPSLHVEQAHGRFADTRFYLNGETRPWVHGTSTPRRAGVDSFGFGGINAHAVLEEAPVARGAATAPGPTWPSELVVVGAADHRALRARCESLAASLREAADLRAVAERTVAEVPELAEQRLAVVAHTGEDLRVKLVRAADALADRERRRFWSPDGVYWTGEPLGAAGVAFVFPGEGSQHVGMLQETALAFPAVRRWFDLVDHAFAGHPAGLLPSRAVFPPPGRTAAEETLQRMDVGPAAIFAANQGLLDLMTALGVTPAAVTGHSSGEWSAMVAAGVLTVDDEERVVADIAGLNAVYERMVAEDGVPRATLLAVGGTTTEQLAPVLAATGGAVAVALDNCPHQAVLCGSPEAIRDVEAELSRTGAVCERLTVDRAYHTRAFSGFADRVRRHLDTLEVSAPRVRLYSCCTAAPFPGDVTAVRDLAARQWESPVRFRETVDRMYADGARVFVEVGPAANLTAFVGDILRGRPHLAVPVDGTTGGVTALNSLAGQLFAHHVPIRLDVLHQGRGGGSQPSSGLPLATHLPDLVLRDVPQIAQPRPTTAAPSAAVQPGREAAVRAHLRTMEKFLEVQADVLRAFASGEPLAPPPASPEPPPAPEPARVVDAVEPDARPARTDFADLVRELLHDRTGYPLDLLEDDMDLEADLGIDSIKRVEILGAIQREHGTLAPDALSDLRTCRTIRRIADGLAQAYGTDGPAPAAAAVHPCLDEVLERGPGRLVAACTWDVDRDPFLRDHTLEHTSPSRRDRTLLGLPVVPLTMSLELAAEAALACHGEGSVTTLHDVEARRWMTVDGRRRVIVSVEALTAGSYRVEVQDPEATGFDAIFVNATVDIGTTPPEPPVEVAPDGAGVGDTDVYGPDGLFHGPTFQVVASLDRVGDDTAWATLRSPGARIVGREGLPAIDPALLDGPGQVLALWLARRTPDRRDVFPVRLARLDLYRPPDPGPASYTVAVRVREVDDHRLVSDLDVVADGRVVAAFRGWEDVRIGLPDDLRAMLARPDEGWLSTTWQPPPCAAAPELRGRRARLPEELASESRGIWLDVLAWCVLAADEREQWRALAAAQAGRRLEWLAGRIAAKEAVRELQDRFAADADVTILVDEHGSPVVREGLGGAPAPLVSIAHSAGEAVAVAASAHVAGGIGVDLQPVGSVPAGVEVDAFGAGERHLLDAVGVADRAALAARMWTAKEAVAKATGDGLSLRPADTPLTTQEPDPGRAGPVAFAPVDRTEAQTWTDLDAGVAYAVCVLPAAADGGPSGH